MSASADPVAGVPAPWVTWSSKRPFTQSGRAGVTQVVTSPSVRGVTPGSSDSIGDPWCGATGVHHTNHGLAPRPKSVITRLACAPSTPVE